MTQEHPITPPPELVQQWVAEIWHEGSPVQVSADNLHVATQAAHWGADQELEACCEALLSCTTMDYASEWLRAARRPNPPSLKEQALSTLNVSSAMGYLKEEAIDTIRRALEQLDD